MSSSLSQTEIKRRLVRLSNLENLHVQQKERNLKLETENRELRNTVLKLEQIVEKQANRIEELEIMIFGRKKDKDNPGSKDKLDASNDQTRNSEKKPLSPPRRPNPKEPEVTHEPVPLTVSACKHCGGRLAEFENVIRFIEDIDITALINKALKKVTKLTIERGKCTKCGKWTSAQDLRGQTCMLGSNVKLVIPYLITVLDQTYEQVQTTLQDFFGLTVSDAEITRILARKGVEWRPKYNRIDAIIRGQPGNHCDETTWNIQAFAKHCFAWIKTGTVTNHVLFKLALSRGAHHAKQFIGRYSGVIISDGYSPYRKLAKKHQLCWAHLIRKARDLAGLKSLAKEKHDYCVGWYARLMMIYQKMEKYRAQPFDQQTGNQQAGQLTGQIRKLCQPHLLDPHKLTNLKKHMLDYQSSLFTCLTVDGIPSDNNKAERNLRPLVIKRKKSFGSKTEQGAKHLEVILSVIWSTWRTNRNNFWKTLQGLEKT